MRTPILAAAVLLVGLLSAAQSALAGDFVLLPSTAPLRVTGVNNPNNDPLRLDEGPIIGSDGFGSLYAAPSFLVMLEQRSSSIVYLGNTVGTLFDYVFRDTSDGNRLVFGSRIVMGDNNFEINDIFRTGYTGYAVSAAWSFGSDIDLRLYSAARSTTPLLGGPDVFSPGTVNLRTDINDAEANPRSGYFYVKTDATDYRVYANAMTLRQSGEEGQPPTNIAFAAFAPVATSSVGAPSQQVPLPEWSLGLLAAGLASAALRRRG